MLKFFCNKLDTNYHSANRETVRGWKLKALNLKKANESSRARFYWRVILYFPDGSWWNLDLAWVRRRA